jgi:hypothetical protein
MIADTINTLLAQCIITFGIEVDAIELVYWHVIYIGGM